MSSIVEAIPTTLVSSDNNGEMTNETTNAAIEKEEQEGQEGKREKEKFYKSVTECYAIFILFSFHTLTHSHTSFLCR